MHGPPLSIFDPGRMVQGRRLAFTLIELLVVIAIIGILAALLLTQINGIKQKANKVASASNLKQISAAFGLYIADNGKYPPNNGSGTAKHPGQRWWPSYLAPYCGNNPKVFWRPGAPSDWKYLGVAMQTGGSLSFASPVDSNNSPTIWGGTWTEDDKPIKWNYWVNGNCLMADSTDQNTIRRPPEFTYPARTVVLMEGFLWATRDRWFIWPDGTVNVLWADGHVSAEKPGNISNTNLIVK